MNIFSIGISDIGRVRENNEDNFFINGVYKERTEIPIFTYADMNERDIHIFAVCDGMGGESLGELASLRTVELLGSLAPETIYASPLAVMEAANERICSEIVKNNGKRIGTTASVLMIKGDFCKLCHIGDSRVYRLRSQQIEILSKDHTQGQQMIDAGVISEEEARNSRGRHILTQHLGIFPEEFVIEPQITNEMEVLDGDIYLLCSDGLTDMLEPEAIKDILAKAVSGSVTKTASELVRLALKNGGKDNTTVIVIKVVLK